MGGREVWVLHPVLIASVMSQHQMTATRGRIELTSAEFSCTVKLKVHSQTCMPASHTELNFKNYNIKYQGNNATNWGHVPNTNKGSKFIMLFSESHKLELYI